MLSTLNKISCEHNTCEDNFMIHETDDTIQGVVADGCSTGLKSAFASQLFCYLFESVAKIKIDVTMDVAVSMAAWESRRLAKQLFLTVRHLQTTLILFNYNKGTKKLLVRIFGDGFYYVNGVEYMVEQDNEPDYLAYHLNDMIPFMEKYKVMEYDNVTDFKICSDGISSFSLPQTKESDLKPKEMLLSSNMSANHLERKFNIIKKQGWVIKDDLTIISYHDSI